MADAPAALLPICAWHRLAPRLPRSPPAANGSALLPLSPVQHGVCEFLPDYPHARRIQYLIRAIAGDVAGAIPAPLLPHDKLLSGALFIAIVSGSDAHGADPQLTFDSVQAISTLLIHHVALYVARGTVCWQQVCHEARMATWDRLAEFHSKLSEWRLPSFPLVPQSASAPRGSITLAATDALRGRPLPSLIAVGWSARSVAQPH